MRNYITPITDYNFPMDAVRVICATLNGKLALHKSIDRRGYTLTHIPTGYALRVGIRNKMAAEDVMLAIENEDWNFKVSHSPKWAAQKNRLKPIVFALPIW
jgi:hypothetical protein